MTIIQAAVGIAEETTSLTNLGVAFVMLVILIERIGALVSKILSFTKNGKNGKHSGDQSIEFWELKVGQIVEQKLSPLVASTERNSELLQDIRDSLRDLVNVLRAKESEHIGSTRR